MCFLLVTKSRTPTWDYVIHVQGALPSLKKFFWKQLEMCFLGISNTNQIDNEVVFILCQLTTKHIILNSNILPFPLVYDFCLIVQNAFSPSLNIPTIFNSSNIVQKPILF